MINQDLKIGSEKGFLLNDIKDLLPKIEMIGLETSEYAIKNSMPSIKKMSFYVKTILN